MNITSKEIMIFKKEFEDGKVYYRASLSNKKQDNTYETAYIDVRLPKGVELENKSKISITKGFLTFYKTKDKKDIWYIVVQEFTTEEQKNKEVMVIENISAEQLDDKNDALILPF